MEVLGMVVIVGVIILAGVVIFNRKFNEKPEPKNKKAPKGMNGRGRRRG